MLAFALGCPRASRREVVEASACAPWSLAPHILRVQHPRALQQHAVATSASGSHLRVPLPAQRVRRVLPVSMATLAGCSRTHVLRHAHAALKTSERTGCNGERACSLATLVLTSNTDASGGTSPCSLRLQRFAT